MAWTTDDELVGQTVEIATNYGETELAIVLAVSDRTGNLKVRTIEDGEILVGNQWEYAE